MFNKVHHNVCSEKEVSEKIQMPTQFDFKSWESLLLTVIQSLKKTLLEECCDVQYRLNENN